MKDKQIRSNLDEHSNNAKAVSINKTPANQKANKENLVYRMKHRKFNISFYRGFKKVGSSQMISSSTEGLTLEEAQKYCEEKFPSRKVKVSV
ncbi:hypothetical protein NVP1111B_33 [Vibrio phage 1.111.B._10N.286.45.E6]|nr:hypothetical protein NVP1111A_33 [Vibrio phage 1.111.A._10N.286.45.E6]AUR88289.1 hypothetical protein NVP1111B_33 [Vibrio phage 1.111.B._10N.286.45.E6]